ncbi:hypothetical protein ACN6K8_000269 [[Kitasatospora] papulosa]|uniref:hypothetical protein n=1 Tax=[Kitasatospora] papulosa TaxID=1464011 RepID=UPI00403C72FD
MLEIVPVDEIDDDWPPYDREVPRRRMSAGSRLAALRRSFFESAVSTIAPHRPIRVSTYVLAGPGFDIDAEHALLGEFAEGRHWRVHHECFTDQTPGSPTLADKRPEFNRACRHAGAGFVDGILMTNRDAMPAADDAYEHILHWLHDRRAFIAYGQPTPRKDT